MTHYAYERIQAGLSMSGLFEVSRTAPAGRLIEDILLLAECSLENEWEGQIPLPAVKMNSCSTTRGQPAIGSG
jgi:hypothetical protein